MNHNDNEEAEEDRRDSTEDFEENPVSCQPLLTNLIIQVTETLETEFTERR